VIGMMSIYTCDRDDEYIYTCDRDAGWLYLPVIWVMKMILLFHHYPLSLLHLYNFPPPQNCAVSISYDKKYNCFSTLYQNIGDTAEWIWQRGQRPTTDWYTKCAFIYFLSYFCLGVMWLWKLDKTICSNSYLSSQLLITELVISVTNTGGKQVGIILFFQYKFKISMVEVYGWNYKLNPPHQ